MEPSHFGQANAVLKAPESSHKNIVDLPVWRQEDGTMTSMWEPTEAERNAITGGASILLHVNGPHPVVAIGVNADVYGDENETN